MSHFGQFKIFPDLSSHKTFYIPIIIVHLKHQHRKSCCEIKIIPIWNSDSSCNSTRSNSDSTAFMLTDSSYDYAQINPELSTFILICYFHIDQFQFRNLSQNWPLIPILELESFRVSLRLHWIFTNSSSGTSFRTGL